MSKKVVVAQYPVADEFAKQVKGTPSVLMTESRKALFGKKGLNRNEASSRAKFYALVAERLAAAKENGVTAIHLVGEAKHASSGIFFGAFGELAPSYGIKVTFQMLEPKAAAAKTAAVAEENAF